MCGFYTLDDNQDNIKLFNITELPLFSNIIPNLDSFNVKAEVLTDIGLIEISKINPDIHTIKNQKIIGITKTISLDNFFIIFEKYSIDINIPNRKSIVNKKHKIYYKKKFIKAIDLIDNINIKKINNNGNKILYNILMETHNIICINNMIVETLHPKNIIAQLYLLNSYK